MEEEEKKKKTGIRLLAVAALLAFVLVVSFCLADEKNSSARRWREAFHIAQGKMTTHQPHVVVDPESVQLYLDLKKASMEDGTVILSTLNEAWAAPGSMFDLFRESFLMGEETRPLLQHLLLIVVDEKAMGMCRSMHPHCHLLRIQGVESAGGEKVYMSKDYFAWMWQRTRFLGKVLEFGFSFVLTDLDILWFRTPFPHFDPHDDFTIACDIFNGTSTDPAYKLVNGGYMYVRSNNRTVKFYRHWYESRTRFPGKHEQAVFNYLKTGPFVRRLGMKMRFLNTTTFAGFCQHGEDLAKMCTLHANCCVGLGNKIYDLSEVLQIWRNFTRLPDHQRSARAIWKGPVKCRI